MIRLLIHRNTVLPNGDYVDNGCSTYDLYSGSLEDVLCGGHCQIIGYEIRKDNELPRLYGGVNSSVPLEMEKKELAAYAPLSNLTIQQYDALVRDAMKWRQYSTQQNKPDQEH